MSSRIIKESLEREQVARAAREALDQTIAREEALRRALERTALTESLDIREVGDLGAHFVLTAGRPWSLECPIWFKCTSKFGFVLSPKEGERFVSDQHHSRSIVYLPEKRQVVVRCTPWLIIGGHYGTPYDGLKCATSQPRYHYYGVTGNIEATQVAPGGFGVMFALDGSRFADVGYDGTLTISSHVRKPLPDLGGEVGSGCSGEAGTTTVFLSVGSKVHRVDYDARTIVRTWYLPGPVLQLASGPRGIAFALIKEGLFTVGDDGCAFVRDRVQGIFSCPAVSGSLYVSC